MKSLAIIFGFLTMAFFGVGAFADDEPANERQNEGQNLFDRLDADGNGRLSSSEIPEEQVRFFQRLLRVGDADDDGELSREEFRNATREREAPAAQPRDGERRPGGVGFPIGQFFERFDANGDGKLTLEEIPERARPQLERLFEGREEITLDQLRSMRNEPNAGSFIRRLDADGDGKVKLSDLPQYLRPRLEPLFERLGTDELEVDRLIQALGQQGDRRPPEGRPAPAFLRVLDGDRDGRISREELAAAGEKFDELDRNGDGQIDLPELFGGPGEGPPPEGVRRGQRPRPEGETGRPRRPERENGESRPERPRSERPGAESRSRDSQSENP